MIEGTGTQEAKTFQWPSAKVNKIDYLLYLPEDYGLRPEERWPLILFLHRAGESGNNIEKIKQQGLPKMLLNKKDFPFIVVSPQCSRSASWYTLPLIPLLDEVMSNYAVDPDRVYLTGISMGGYGAWSLAIEIPNRFAAIAPICGGGDPSAVCAIKDVPVWAFHGAKDDVIPVEETLHMVAALKSCGGDVKVTIYPEAGHDSWTQTYANPELYTWFLEHRRGTCKEAA